MIIKDQKDLEKLIRMLQKSGVESIKIGDIEIRPGRRPLKASNKPKVPRYTAPEESIKVPAYNGVQTESEASEIDTEGPSDEDLLMWSVTGEAN